MAKGNPSYPQAWDTDMVCEGGNDAPSRRSLWSAIVFQVLEKGIQASQLNLEWDPPKDDKEI